MLAAKVTEKEEAAKLTETSKLKAEVSRLKQELASKTAAMTELQGRLTAMEATTALEKQVGTLQAEASSAKEMRTEFMRGLQTGIKLGKGEPVDFDFQSPA